MKFIHRKNAFCYWFFQWNRLKKLVRYETTTSSTSTKTIKTTTTNMTHQSPFIISPISSQPKSPPHTNHHVHHHQNWIQLITITSSLLYHQIYNQLQHQHYCNYHHIIAHKTVLKNTVFQHSLHIFASIPTVLKKDLWKWIRHYWLRISNPGRISWARNVERVVLEEQWKSFTFSGVF